MATYLNGAYNKLAGLLAIKLAQNLPVLLNTEQQVSKEVFESGRAANGFTMNYVLPDYGQVLEGPTIDESKMDYTAGIVPVTLRQFNIPFSAGNYTMVNGGNAPTYPQLMEDPGKYGGTAETRNLLQDFDKQVKFPYGANLASKMQKLTIAAGFAGSGTKIVLDANAIGNGVTLWDAMSMATSAIRNARADDDVFGVVSPRLAAFAARGAANLFHPGDRISKLWTKCELGEFATAKWFETADMGIFKMPAAGTGLAVGDTAPTIDPTFVMTEGATEIPLSAAIGAVIPKGTPFYIVDSNNERIKQVDPIGYETGVDFCFALAEDTAATDTSLKIQPIYTKGGLKNVTKLIDMTQDACTIEPVLQPDTSYATGLVWAKPGLATAWGQMDNLDGANNFTFNDKGLLFYGASMADIVHRRNIWRLDTLKGETVTMTNWVASIFVEII